MEPLPVAFFCGHESRWGRAHLDAMLSNPGIDVVEVVLASPDRWATFRTALRGGEPLGPALGRSTRRRVGRLVRRGTPAAATAIEVLRHRGVPIRIVDDANVWEPESHELPVLFSAAYPQIFSREFLDVWSVGAFNSHPSLLPAFRGAHPVFWTVARGAARSGGTIHVLTEGLDEGPIAAQVGFDLPDRCTYAQLYALLEDAVPDLIAAWVEGVRAGREPQPQDHDRAEIFRNEREIHLRLFPSAHRAVDLDRLVRASSGRAFLFADGQRVRVAAASLPERNRNLTNAVTPPPGTVVDVEDGSPIVTTTEGLLRFDRWEADARRGGGSAFRVGQLLQ